MPAWCSGAIESPNRRVCRSYAVSKRDGQRREVGTGNAVPEYLAGPSLLTGTSLTFAGLAIGCLIACVLNRKFTYDREPEGREPASVGTPTTTRWRLLAAFSAGASLVLLVTRFALYEGAPSGVERLQPGTLPAVVIALTAQSASLLGVVANPDRK
jgi:hypothetical protein